MAYSKFKWLTQYSHGDTPVVADVWRGEGRQGRGRGHVAEHAHVVGGQVHGVHVSRGEVSLDRGRAVNIAEL